MDKYHIYEEIGRGRHSVVYKGRRKQTIRYVAVKSVEKALMAKVQNEVHIVYYLEHANVLKFYTWYATRNHTWLVQEYCVGGDLATILRQDRRLPETSVKFFGTDLMAGLHYVHGCGVIHCDVKPSNVLVDENGLSKLCDFSLSQRVPDLKDVGARGLHGTPTYMAPELFKADGVHSFASDLWAFGCTLYELLTGSPPFVGDTYDALVHAITYEQPALPLGGNPDLVSADLVDLLSGLLRKDPAKRSTWHTVRTHPFWTGVAPVPAAELPPQPAFEAYVMLRVAPPADVESKLGEDSFAAAGAGDGDSVGEDEGKEAPVEAAGVPLGVRLLGGSPTEVLFTPQDFTAEPLVCNTSIEDVALPHVKASQLPFAPMRASALDAASQEAAQAHAGLVFKALSTACPGGKAGGGPRVKAALAMLAYVCNVVQRPVLAGVFANSSVTKLMLKLFKVADNGTTVRHTAALAVGLALRNSAFVSPSVACEKVTWWFRDVVHNDNSTPLRRIAAAVLGELLFYMATAEATARHDAFPLPGFVVPLFTHLLSPAEGDDVVRHYTVKTMENVLAQGHKGFASKLATQDLGRSLVDIATRSKRRGLRASAACCVVHMMRVSPGLTPRVLDLRGPAKALTTHGFRAGATPRALLATLNTINLILADLPATSPTALRPLREHLLARTTTTLLPAVLTVLQDDASMRFQHLRASSVSPGGAGGDDSSVDSGRGGLASPVPAAPRAELSPAAMKALITLCLLVRNEGSGALEASAHVPPFAVLDACVGYGVPTALDALGSHMPDLWGPVMGTPPPDRLHSARCLSVCARELGYSLVSCAKAAAGGEHGEDVTALHCLLHAVPAFASTALFRRVLLSTPDALPAFATCVVALHTAASASSDEVGVEAALLAAEALMAGVLRLDDRDVSRAAASALAPALREVVAAVSPAISPPMVVDSLRAKLDLMV